MMLFLSESEIQSLTGRTRHAAQVRALRAMGVEHLVRPDGRPLVLKSHIDNLLAGGNPKAPKTASPDWTALG